MKLFSWEVDQFPFEDYFFAKISATYKTMINPVCLGYLLAINKF